MRKKVKKNKPVVVNLSLAKKILAIVDKGLVNGIGIPKPGKMCVEAAVAFASGEDHNDNPQCVDDFLAGEKITLNDADGWKNDKDRAKGLRRVAIAQLGSRGKLNRTTYKTLLCKEVMPLIMTGVKEGIVSRLNDAIAEVEHADSIQELREMYAVDIIDGDTDTMALEATTQLDTSDCLDMLYEHTNMTQHEALITVAEAVVRVLIKMKIKGTKYLHLTERKKRKK